jgi:hypothetical protein
VAANSPAGSMDPPKTKWFICGRVMQKVDTGILVQCFKSGTFGLPEPPDNSIVYLKGDFPNVVDDDRYTFYAYPIGTYEYVAVNGAKKTVRAFELIPQK